MEIKTNSRLDYKDGVGLRFGVVVTLKEMYGVNRIEEFIRNCHLNGWIVNKIDVQNRINLHEKVNEEMGRIHGQFDGYNLVNYRCYNMNWCDNSNI